MESLKKQLYMLRFSLPGFFLPSVLIFLCTGAKILFLLFQEAPVSAFEWVSNSTAGCAALLMVLVCFLLRLRSNSTLVHIARERHSSEKRRIVISSFSRFDRKAVEVLITYISPVLSLLSGDYQWVVSLILLIAYLYFSFLPITIFLDPHLLKRWAFYDVTFEDGTTAILIVPKEHTLSSGPHDVFDLKEDCYACF